jgi:hypothetical protein
MTIIVWFLALIVMGANGYLVVGQTADSQVWKESVMGALFPIYVIVVLYYCLGPTSFMKIITWFKSRIRDFLNFNKYALINDLQNNHPVQQ